MECPDDHARMPDEALALSEHDGANGATDFTASRFMRQLPDKQANGEVLDRKATGL